MLGIFYFKLFIFPPNIKRSIFFWGFTLWTYTRAPPRTHCVAYSTLRPPPSFYNIQKFNLCSKTGISKTAWISACIVISDIFRRIFILVYWYKHPNSGAQKEKYFFLYTNIFYYRLCFFLLTLSKFYFQVSKHTFFFSIGIHSMQDWTATTRHRVTRKRSTKNIITYRRSV